MSKNQTQKYIRLELSQLNEIIDRKIILGKSYKREASRHRFLVSRLNSMQKRSTWPIILNRLIRSPRQYGRV